MVGEWTRQGPGPHQAERQIEIHLVEAIALRQLGQLKVPQGTPQGGLPQLLQPLHRRRAVLLGDAGPLQFSGTELRLGRHGLAVVELLEDAVQAIARLGPPGKRRQWAVVRPGLRRLAAGLG